MDTKKLKSIIEASCQRIAPAWPLKNFVAVNPYAGFTDTPFNETASLLAERGNMQMTMPIQFYLNQIEERTILRTDIEKAFRKQGKQLVSFNRFLKTLKRLSSANVINNSNPLTLVDITSVKSKKNWNEFMIDKTSAWATFHFDEYISKWNTQKSSGSLFQSWKEHAAIDLSTEIMGLKGFRAMIKQIPNEANTFINTFLAELKMDEADLEKYLHSVLLRAVGWASYISGIDFNNKLYEGNNNNLEEFLAVLLTWEYYFFSTYQKGEIKENWYKQLHNTNYKDQPTEQFLENTLLLQDAYDFAAQRNLASAIESSKNTSNRSVIKAQMAFCIDVRSEVYRRNLEVTDSAIETIGFAGFFGLPINYVPLGHSQGKNQCPVLIPSAVEVKEKFSNNTEALKKRINKHQVESTWKKFKSGAVTSFGFVSPLGLSFLPKIIANSFNITRPVDNPKTDGLKKWVEKERTLDLSSISLEQKISMAASALTGMGIKDKLAPTVVFVGHGSSSTNNPHASGLDCGACGGHSGEINALTAQYILNDSLVRKGLLDQGINIPDDTYFVAGLHDTTTDQIFILNEYEIPEKYANRIQDLKASLEIASERTRLERSTRLNIKSSNTEKIKDGFLSRAKDWSQVRPEWGLAGCNAFVIAPRERTRKIDLKGKSFLHSYDWKTDTDFGVLEAIMTAPMVVTSWINLQYYASTTDNLHYGAGNKTLHNVTGGIGVLEGASGDLRIGLPMQSVHNGTNYEHLPQRLNVVIEAPIDAINEILQKHESIKQLCDHSWINLLLLNESGAVSKRYTKNFEWEEFDSTIKITQKIELQTV